MYVYVYMYACMYVNAFALALICHKWSFQPTSKAATTIATITTTTVTAIVATKLPRCRIKSIHYEITGSDERNQRTHHTQGPHSAAR